MSTDLAASRQRPNPPRAAITCAAPARRITSPVLWQPHTAPHCRMALVICSHLGCVHVNPQRISSQLPQEKSQTKCKYTAKSKEQTSVWLNLPEWRQLPRGWILTSESMLLHRDKTLHNKWGKERQKYERIFPEILSYLRQCQVFWGAFYLPHNPIFFSKVQHKQSSYSFHIQAA